MQTVEMPVAARRSGGEERAPLSAGEKGLAGMEVFTGLSGIAGGICFLLRPDGSLMSMHTSQLAGSPFSDYLVPGLFLTVVVGAGTLTAALLLLMRRPFSGELAVVCGGGLVVFELIQRTIVGFNPLQVVYGGLGAVTFGCTAPRLMARYRARRRQIACQQ